jgi:hypothetical protein
MNDALLRNIERVRNSHAPGRRYPLRNLDRVEVGKRKSDGLKACALGPAYNTEEQTEILFSDMMDICVHSNARSFMRVGKQIRHYHIGTPMGEQGSCAKANGLCLDEELRVDAAREAECGDSERNCSLAFVDDKHVRVAYDELLWSKSSAEEYADRLMRYSEPLSMLPEPIAEPTPFLETMLHNPLGNGSWVKTTHKLRPWGRESYRICRSGVAGTADMQVATAAGTFMRIKDNSTNDYDAAISIAHEMQEMVGGAGWSKSQAMSAFRRLGRQRQHGKRAELITFMRDHARAASLMFELLCEQEQRDGESGNGDATTFDGRFDTPARKSGLDASHEFRDDG